MARTITITAAGRGVRRVTAGGRTFPVGEEVPNVAEKTIEALEAMPGVTVDVAGEPDADTPESTDEE